LKIGFAQSKLEDFFLEPPSCISYKGKFEKQGKNMLMNKHSSFLNVNLSDITVGKIPVIELEDNGLYVATGIYDPLIRIAKSWDEKVYDTIMEFGKNYDYVVFDVNPVIYDYMTHKFASHVAKKSGMEKGKDFNYSYSVVERKGSRKDWEYELKNPQFHKIKPLIDEKLKEGLFVERPLLKPELTNSPDVVFLEHGKEYYVAGVKVNIE
jgi:hypothetical protein